MQWCEGPGLVLPQQVPPHVWTSHLATACSIDNMLVAMQINNKILHLPSRLRACRSRPESTRARLGCALGLAAGLGAAAPAPAPPAAAVSVAAAADLLRPCCLARQSGNGSEMVEEVGEQAQRQVVKLEGLNQLVDMALKRTSVWHNCRLITAMPAALQA